jgi:hypothetical protein
VNGDEQKKQTKPKPELREVEGRTKRVQKGDHEREGGGSEESEESGEWMEKVGGSAHRDGA